MFLLSAFVPPECKAYISSGLPNTTEYKTSEKVDVYSFGVLVLMMLTYAYNPITISNILNIPKSMDFAQQLRNKIKCFPSARKYTTKLIDLAVKALHPDPEKRASVSQLMQYISEENILAPEISQKLEDDYIIVAEISNLAMTSLQEIESPREKKVPFPVLGSTIPDEDEVLSLFLVEHKQTSKRYNAFCITFRREKHAIEYYNDHWKYRISLAHENIVPIEAVYSQKTGDGRSQVCLVKVCIAFYSMQFDVL